MKLEINEDSIMNKSIWILLKILYVKRLEDMKLAKWFTLGFR